MNSYMESSENIELRSKKVRNIIGKVPPMIIRSGIAVYFIIFTIIVILCFNLRFPNYIKCKAELIQRKDTVFYSIVLNQNQFKAILIGQNIVFALPTQGDLMFLYSNVQNVDSVMYVSHEESFNKVYGFIVNNQIMLTDTINVKTNIYIDSTNVIQRIFAK